MKSIIPLGTKDLNTVSVALDNDIVFSDAINIFLDAEDDIDDSTDMLWGEPAEPRIEPETKGQGGKGANH